MEVGAVIVVEVVDELDVEEEELELELELDEEAADLDSHVSSFGLYIAYGKDLR